MEEVSRNFEKALLRLDKLEAQKILESLGEESSSNELVSDIVVPALERIGNEWQNGSIALSQIYMSGRICEQLIEDLLPPSSYQRINRPKMAIAVLNDFHFLGKRIVHSHIRSAGYEIQDYGRKTVDELVSCVCEDQIELVFISTLMYSSALLIRQVIDQLEVKAPNVKIIVGGAPFNMDKDLWKEVGAHGMGSDGAEATFWINKMKEDLK